MYMAPKNDHRGGPIDVKSELASRLAESDEAVLNTTLHDVRACFSAIKGQQRRVCPNVNGGDARIVFEADRTWAFEAERILPL